MLRRLALVALSLLAAGVLSEQQLPLDPTPKGVERAHGRDVTLPWGLARAADGIATVLADDEKIAEVDDGKNTESLRSADGHILGTGSLEHVAAVGTAKLFLPRCTIHLEFVQQSYSEVDYLDSEEGKEMLGVAVGSHFAKHCATALKLPPKDCDGLSVSLAALVDSGRPLKEDGAPTNPKAALVRPESAAAPKASVVQNQSTAVDKDVVLAAPKHSHGGEWCLELWQKMHQASLARQPQHAAAPQTGSASRRAARAAVPTIDVLGGLLLAAASLRLG